MSIQKKQAHYQKIIASHELQTEHIKINSQQEELIFKFLTLKKEVDTETVKNELTDVFDLARNLKIEISHKTYHSAQELFHD
ncbi:MAG: hypothetical protein AB7V37_10540, partial [Eubacteriaceae bacterium]